jgi:hypothetical protein
MRRSTLIVAAMLAVSAPASAQTYVAASLVGDITRFSHADVPGFDGGGGEAIGFGLRLGTSITDLFGVEVEFVRPSVIESSLDSEILPALEDLVVLPGVPVFPDVFPPIRYQLRTEARYTTVTTSVWAKQTLTARFSLAYSGGVALVRAHQESSFDYVPGGEPGLPPIPRVPVSFRVSDESVSYSLQPQVGVEARIGMSEHVQLLPGLRLYGLEGGWVLRPAVGLGWTF